MNQFTEKYGERKQICLANAAICLEKKNHRCVVNQWKYRTIELHEKEHGSPVDLMITLMLT